MPRRAGARTLQILGVCGADRAQVTPLDLEQPLQLVDRLLVLRLRLRLPRRTRDTVARNALEPGQLHPSESPVHVLTAEKSQTPVADLNAPQSHTYKAHNSRPCTASIREHTESARIRYSPVLDVATARSSSSTLWAQATKKA
eukprot:229925-Pleurochrysis_carterae.AAC.1